MRVIFAFLALALGLGAQASRSKNVTLKATPCPGTENMQQFTIVLSELVEKTFSVCNLSILSATNTDVSAIVCQAFTDKKGTQPGSAEFMFRHPAAISATPVTQESILCKSTRPEISLSSAPASSQGGESTTAAAPRNTGAAGKAGVGVGAVAGGLAALLL